MNTETNTVGTGAVPPDAETAVGWYELMVEVLRLQGRIRSELGGRDLACWCKDGPCHADVLLQIANPDEPLLQAEMGTPPN